MVDSIRPSAGSVARIEAPGYQARVFFLGANGSGKTVLAARMMAGYPRVIVLDIKYDFPIPWAKGEYVITHKPPGVGNLLERRKWNADRIIYRPGRGYDSGEWMAYFLDWCFEKGRKSGKKKPFILYLDEGAWIASQGAKSAIARLAIAGRSLGIGLWVTAQRPRNIPVEVRSEAWRTYLFFLQYQDDEDELIKYSKGQLTREDLRVTLDDYSFWELRRGKGGQVVVTHYPPVRPISAGG